MRALSMILGFIFAVFIAHTANASTDIESAASEMLNEVEAEFFDEKQEAPYYAKKRKKTLSYEEREVNRELEDDQALSENHFGILEVDEDEPFRPKKTGKEKAASPFDMIPNGTATIEFSYIMPGWEIYKSSKNHRPEILGVSDSAANEMLSWNTKTGKRCEVKGHFKDKGVFIVSVSKCRGMLLAEY